MAEGCQPGPSLPVPAPPGLAGVPPSAGALPNAVAPCWRSGTWYTEQEEPRVILSRLSPDQAGVSWYALRFRIELGFKALKGLGGQWQRTRRTSPARISLHWLALPVAALLALAYGNRVEDACDRRKSPGSLRTPPRTLASTHRNSSGKPGRTVRIIRPGIVWLRRLLHLGQPWSRVWLLPEPWPEPKSNLKITRVAPP